MKKATASWRSRVDAYLSYRRGLGFSLIPDALYLAQFARLAQRRHAQHLTVTLAIEWACMSKRPTAITRANRIMRLRGFARYCQRFDPGGEIPPPGLFGRTRRRLMPHIYTEQEVTSLLEATSGLRPRGGLRPLTYRALCGLLASCGLRIGEALRLRRTDVDLNGGMLSIRNSKHHKSRFVPLHPTTVRALRAYVQQRDRRVAAPQSDHFFLLDNGKPPRRQQICCTLHTLTRQLGWRPRGDYPKHRVQDLRHTFIVRNMVRAIKRGRNAEQIVPALSAYVGHDNVSHTYWYITGTPQLMALAAQRFQHHAQVSS